MPISILKTELFYSNFQLRNLKLPSAMINFMFQLDWATDTRHWVKRYFRGVCEDVVDETNI